MLSEEDATWLIAIAKQRLRDVSEPQTGAIIRDRLAEIERKLEQPVELLELLIHCPRCLKQHIDEGIFATHPHNKHACQFCGLGFVASKQPSVGVQFFSGWKNENSAGIELKPHQATKPAASLPIPLPLFARLLYTGQTVRFNRETADAGCNFDKTFTIAEVKFTFSGTFVRLEEEGTRAWYPQADFIVVPP